MLTRRAALQGGTATVATIVAGGTVAAETTPDLLREGVQALVNEIRGPAMEKKGVMVSFCALQEVADWLETLPGIKPVQNDMWENWKPLVGAGDLWNLEMQFSELRLAGRALS